MLCVVGKVSAIWGSSSHNTSGSHGNHGNYRKKGSSAIKFYHKHEFTNFYQAPLQIDSKVWAMSLTKMLLDKGDRKLVEHMNRDSYWGDGGDGSGQNRLGKLLMKLREELRKEMEAVSGPVSQGGRKRRIKGGGEGVQSRAKKVSSDASDTGSSVD